MNTQVPKHTRQALFAALASLALMVPTASHAAPGTWNVDAAGNWQDAGNWSGSTIADGADNTANFTFNLTGDRIVTATAGGGWSGTIGHMTFEDLTTASHNWRLNSGTVTLDATGGTSTINVVNRTATIGTTVLAGNAIEKTGAGSLALFTATSSFNGLTISQGTVIFDAGDVVASGNSRFGSGTVTLNGGSIQLAGSSARTLARALSLSASGGTISSGSGASLTVSGVISNLAGTPYSLTFNQAGVRAMMINQAANTFGGLGQTVGIGGTVNVLGDGSLGHASNSINLTAGGTVHFGNTGATPATFTTARAIAVSGSSALSVEDGSTLNVDGVITGANTLTFNNGAGYNATGVTIGAAGANSVAVLSGDTSGFSGNVTVSNGKLLVNSSLGSSSTVTVSSTGTLGGSGTIAGAVNVSGTLSPGNSIESLGTGTLTFNGGSAFDFEVDSSVALAVGADFTKVTGNLNLGGVVTLQMTDLAATDVAFANGTTFTLFNYSGTWNGGLFTFGSALADDSSFVAGLNEWKIDYNATSGGSNFASEYGSGSFVNLVVIPEPGTLTLVGVALLSLVALRRRKH